MLQVVQLLEARGKIVLMFNYNIRKYCFVCVLYVETSLNTRKIQNMYSYFIQCLLKGHMVFIPHLLLVT